MRGWEKLHNEELHNLYSSSNITGVIKSRKKKWAGHTSHMEEMCNSHKILVEKLEGKREFEDLNLSGRIILKWILGMSRFVVWTGFIWLSIGTSGKFL
jgi:hypothetical protein